MCLLKRKKTTVCASNAIKHDSYEADFSPLGRAACAPLKYMMVAPSFGCQSALSAEVKLWSRKIIVPSQLQLDMLTWLLVGPAAERNLYIFIMF